MFMSQLERTEDSVKDMETYQNTFLTVRERRLAHAGLVLRPWVASDTPVSQTLLCFSGLQILVYLLTNDFTK